MCLHKETDYILDFAFNYRHLRVLSDSMVAVIPTQATRDRQDAPSRPALMDY